MTTTNDSIKFDIDRSNRVVNVNVVFEAPLTLVWDAWTKADILDQWWGPKPWKAVTKEQTFENGGEWFYAMVGPNDEKHWSLCTYEDIQKHEYYRGTDAFCDENKNINEDMPQSKWDISFKDQQDGTTWVNINIAFEREEDLDEQLKMGFQEGFTIGLTQLQELLPQLK